MATRKTKEEESIERSKVAALEAENLTLMNQLNLSLKIRGAKKEELDLQKQIKELGRKAVIDANKYSKVNV